MNGTVTSDEIKVMYTDKDGIIPRKLKLTDYLKEKKQKLYAQQKQNYVKTSRLTLKIIIIIVCGRRIGKAKKEV